MVGILSPEHMYIKEKRCILSSGLNQTYKRFVFASELGDIRNINELYDVYSILLDILSKAKQEIIIIDNYSGKELLDLLKKINIIIVSKNIDETLKKKYVSQYNNISFINNNSFHDRYIIIDKSTIYHLGASFKDLGKKCFAINEFKEKSYLKEILKILDL